MKINDSDKNIIRALVNQRKKVKFIAPDTQKDDQMQWGVSFNDLFRDINETISFSEHEGNVYVIIDEKTMLHGENLNEEAYIQYNQKMSLQVKVIQRLMLLRSLEEKRFIIWINTGKSIPNIENKNKYFYLSNDEDKNYVKAKFAYEAVATDELVEFVKNKFKTIEDIRFKKSMRNSWIAIGVAIVIGILSFIINRCN